MTNGTSSASAFKTEQETFWHGEFGSRYTERNTSDTYVDENTAFFGKIFGLSGRPRSVLELGANSGVNLRGIQALDKDIQLAAVEINPDAVSALRASLPQAQVHHGSLLDFTSESQWDFVFIKGVLIHINPDFLKDAYRTLYRHSARHILIAEYYNITPMEMPYRGHAGKLYKRDFCGEMMDAYPDLKLVDYGFVYHRDPYYKSYDDVTWFLLEKTK